MPMTLLTAPTSYPITLDEAKSQLREGTDDNDTLIFGILKAATNDAEVVTWRRFVTQTWTYYADSFGSLSLPYGQLQSVTSIKYYDSLNVLQTLSTSIYDVDNRSDPGHISLAYSQSWPEVYDKHNAIEVEYICGYTLVPEVIKQAIKLKCELMFGNLFNNEFDTYERSYQMMLDPYRLVRF